ncbi:ran-specific GTPase-activating protein-like [Clavelina lepadiformis]|uniref:ran-specific GTPase-activating protein-like n=1 Tax=Clavelina lepadiformis TaxID=159417 RepID=UPI00404257C5
MTEEEQSHDPQFKPLVQLPEQIIPELETDEEVLFKMRAKLFRWAVEADPPEWKERGTGDVKLLRHKSSSKIRLLMRRDKTLKICANHYLTKEMTLVPNASSDRAWVWTTFADFCDNETKKELLAIRFLNSENANKFKTKFEECQEILEEAPDKANDLNDDENAPTPEKKKESSEETEEVAEKLEELKVKDDEKQNSPESSAQDKKTLEVEDSPEK